MKYSDSGLDIIEYPIYIIAGILLIMVSFEVGLILLIRIFLFLYGMLLLILVGILLRRDNNLKNKYYEFKKELNEIPIKQRFGMKIILVSFIIFILSSTELMESGINNEKSNYIILFITVISFQLFVFFMILTLYDLIIKQDKKIV